MDFVLSQLVAGFRLVSGNVYGKWLLVDRTTERGLSRIWTCRKLTSEDEVLLPMSPKTEIKSLNPLQERSSFWN